MPTGYTAAVVDGTITEFRDFALTCARAFGALITMRDERLDAPLPAEIVPQTTYYDDRLKADRQRLDAVQAMTKTEAETAAANEYFEASKSRTKYLEDKEAEASRINQMLSKVRLWTPPSPDHEEMKSFMIEQLTISMPGDYSPAPAVLLGGEEWRKKEIDRLTSDISRNQSEVEKEIQRSSKRNAWLNQLRAAL